MFTTDRVCARLGVVLPSASLMLVACLVMPPQAAAPGPRRPLRQQSSEANDGSRDFDFEIGTWHTHLRRLVKPLSGDNTWVEYDGTTIVRTVGGGPANLVELDVAGVAGRIEGLSLRLYNPETRRWSLHFSNRAAGTLEPPVTGRFANGRGEFLGDDTLNGHSILVRFVISDITPARCRFEQAFSADGGTTWEINWIATDTR